MYIAQKCYNNLDMKRLKYFDTVKGIGILLVVLGHATFVNERLLTFIFSFHMPLFFIVSGMLTAYKDGSGSTLRDVFYRKLKTIIIPYLCFSICYTLIDILSVFKRLKDQSYLYRLICRKRSFMVFAHAFHMRDNI